MKLPGASAYEPLSTTLGRVGLEQSVFQGLMKNNGFSMENALARPSAQQAYNILKAEGFSPETSRYLLESNGYSLKGISEKARYSLELEPGPNGNLLENGWEETFHLPDLLDDGGEDLLQSQGFDIPKIENEKFDLWDQAANGIGEEFDAPFDTMSSVAKDFYAKASSQEVSITKALQDVAKFSGGELSGLEYRIKTPESFARKVNSEAYEYTMLHPDVGYEEAYQYATSRMYDTVRYTMLAEPDNFTDVYYQTIYNLEQSGYTVSRVKNSLSNVYSSYRGVNTVITTPDGFHFELQFHTPESLEVKNKTHVLYEELRKVGTSETRKAELKRQMQALTQCLETPKGVDKILPFDTLKGR